MPVAAAPGNVGRPRLMSLDDRREALLDAAVVQFAERGYAGASVEVIANLAGVSRPLVYELFSDKQALYQAAIRREVIRLAGAMHAGRAATRGLPLRDRIAVRYRTMVTAALSQPGGTGLLARVVESRAQSGSEIGDRIVASMAASLRDELRELGLPHDQLPDQVAHLALSLGYAVVRGCRANATWPPDALVEMISEMTFALLTSTARDVLDAADAAQAKDQQ